MDNKGEYEIDGGKENNDGNSRKTMLLPLNRLTTTDCNTAAPAKTIMTEIVPTMLLPFDCLMVTHCNIPACANITQLSKGQPYFIHIPTHASRF